MKTVLKWVAGMAVVLIDGVIAFVVAVEIYTGRTERQVIESVKGIVPGSAIADIDGRLGKPDMIVTNRDEISRWIRADEKAMATNCFLHLYATKSIPFRWILVFAETNSGKVVSATWMNM